jgi:NTE family protein
MRRVHPDGPSAILARLAYRAPGHQRSLKPLDYSRPSLEERVIQGRADIDVMLRRLAAASRTEALHLSPGQDNERG